MSKAGMPALRFHDLRSNAATALVAAGAWTSRLPRPASVTPTLSLTLAIYARATADADRKAADAVGQRLRPRDPRAMRAGERHEAGWGSPENRI